jgi:predicted nucleic acid-binding protein
MAVTVFLDTSVLLGGLVDFGPQSAPAHTVLHAVAEKTIPSPATAWHCCLEFYSVATRLPPEFRLAPSQAMQLLDEEIIARLAIHDLPPGARLPMLRHAAAEGTAGGRIYDAHIAEIARSAEASIIVTDNRKHFVAALRHGIRVETTAEFAAALRRQKSK